MIGSCSSYAFISVIGPAHRALYVGGKAVLRKEGSAKISETGGEGEVRCWHAMSKTVALRRLCNMRPQ